MTQKDDAERLIDEVTAELGEFREAADRLDEVVAAQFALNRTDLRCLGILYRRGRMTAGELAAESGLSPGAITTVLDRMERGGYANRVADPGDRRRVLVVSTAATREVGARLYGEVEVRGRTWLEGRAVPELQLIKEYLDGTRSVYEDQAAHIAGQAEGADEAATSGAPEASAPLGDLPAGRLEFTRGASIVELSGGAALGELYRARFDGPAPDVLLSGGTVIIQQRRRFRPFDWRTQSSTIELNATRSPGTISLKGGMWKLTARAAAACGSSRSTVAGGASDVEIWLPAPVGTVPVRVSGGASKVTMHRPSGVPVRADISGGASQLVFDKQRLGGVGGRNRLESSGLRRRRRPLRDPFLGRREPGDDRHHRRAQDV